MSGSLTDGPWSLVDGLMGTLRTPCLIEGQFINCPNPVKGEETASHARAGGGGGYWREVKSLSFLLTQSEFAAGITGGSLGFR